MLILERILGHAGDPEMADRLHDLEHHGQVETLILSGEDVQRHRMRVRTDRGTDCAIRAFYDAGCRYLQLDDTVWAYLCSDAQRQQVRERGDDPDALARIYARVLNQALEGKPADLTVGLHVCRGNFRSTWISEGGYEPVAEVLFGGVNVDAFFLEYDNDRSGDFAPLRFIRPGHQQVVLGLITTKNGELENPQGVKARLAEAAQYVPLEQICLSPQCGFASTEEGNALSEDQQWQKVRLVTAIAADVW